MSWELPSGASQYIPNVGAAGYSEAGGQVPVQWEKPDGTKVHTTQGEYNRSRLEGRPRQRPSQRYGRPTTSTPYSRVETNRIRPTVRPNSGVEETSFSEAARERNPGIRYRANAGTSSGVRPSDTRISIPETLEVSSETAPLLGASTASASGTASTVTGALAAVGGALAVGGLSAAVINRIKEKGATLPGSDYVGPGNPINIDAPRHASDAIAKEHDVGYQSIIDRAHRGELSEEEFATNIEQLDEHAIREFARNFHSSGEWHSFVGRWGLYFKNRIEAVTGPLYPTFPGKLWAVNGEMFLRIKNLIGII